MGKKKAGELNKYAVECWYFINILLFYIRFGYD